MITNEKILKALKSAITYLEGSISALNKGDENLLADNVWHVAAELEYALFLFSVAVQTEYDKSVWRLNPEPKKIEVGRLLTLVRDLLGEAENAAANERLVDAYKSTYAARGYMLRVQQDFAKTKREALRGK